MSDLYSSFISENFLRSHWANAYDGWLASGDDSRLLDKLRAWAARKDLKDTSAEAAFIGVFFEGVWGYTQSGQSASEGFSLYPKFSVPGAGQHGGPGEADLALGYFGQEPEPIPQVLCEFKSVKSALDADQRRKGNPRSPVKQCLDYLFHARRGFFGNEPTLPVWALVSDMNEFRLYWHERGHQQSVRFVITQRDLFQKPGLVADSEDARFQRFLFAKIFHRETLLTRGGKCLLESLIKQQRYRDRSLEKEFYSEYRRFREKLYETLLVHNGEGTDRFPGTRGRLVRLAQKILDRLIFIFFCEDMGEALSFPPQILRDFLIARSNDPYLDANGTTIWQEMVALFEAMNAGKAFGGKALNQFNGGLFKTDPALNRLVAPNSIFCWPGQGQNEASLYGRKETVLYLCASYNYATGWSRSLTRPPVKEKDAREPDPEKSLSLYTLGRIFEQSITELEILEAEADRRPSVNKESKRKRDGVYYTPEWVVDRIVDDTAGARLREIKAECGLPFEEKAAQEEKLAALDRYEERLKSFTVVDPACGSGAFLITSLRYLLDEWRSVREQRALLKGGFAEEGADDAAIRTILSANIYGVDINAASVEIARLALWLHTARGDKPLSSLESTIREGNSLIDSRFYHGQADLGLYTEAEKERVNAFDWETEFPEVFARGGFDAVVGNPPYVKLQNFRKVHADMAEYLRNGNGIDMHGYRSAQTGNFDLYLPFIEKGIGLLNGKGRLGYIAPSLWVMNEYGKGLREIVEKNGWLNKWIDFKSYQIFDEATNYTALQYFSKVKCESFAYFPAPSGDLSRAEEAKRAAVLQKKSLAFKERWLIAYSEEKKVIDFLELRCRRLGDPNVTRNIYQGLVTSADGIYHLERIGPNRYLCTPEKHEGVPYEVEIEDAIMKPLVSGAEAKRYQAPKTDTYLLFPYDTAGKGRLLSQLEIFGRFPKAWKYLLSYEKSLRGRESGKMDGDEGWWGYVYPKNLQLNDLPKLIAAQTVPSLRLCYDESGTFYLNNVRVNGIIPAEGIDPWFLLGVMNAPIADFVFKRIGKVKDNNFYEANRQFIAPLPIPYASAEQQAHIGGLARRLQTAHTRRRDILAQIRNRLETLRPRPNPDTWLFPGLPSLEDYEERAPGSLDSARKRDWAKERFNEELERRLAVIEQRLKPGAALSAEFREGELRLAIDGIIVLDRIYCGKEEGAFLLAQWRALLATLNITRKMTASRLSALLRKVAPFERSPPVEQTISLAHELAAVDEEIAENENAINEAVFALYPLTPAQIGTVLRAVEG